jgi:hypothetical protein
MDRHQINSGGTDHSPVDDLPGQPASPFRTPRQFYVARDIWLDQIVVDPTLPPAAFKVAYVLVRYVNWRTFEAFPGNFTLAEETGLSDRWVRNSLAMLKQRRHLLVRVAGHGATRSIYRPHLFEESWLLWHEKAYDTKRK